MEIVTDVSMKMDTCRRVRVDDSAMCSETEHRSSGAGGELSYGMIFGCGGGPFQLGFGFSGTQIGLGLLELGLN